MQIGGFSMEARKAKAAPILASLCADLDVAGVIDRHVQWDAARTKLSPGTSLVAMIINFLVDRRPLYKISRFYRDMDCAWLLGEGVSADLLHDDPVGKITRALEVVPSLELVINQNYTAQVNELRSKAQEVSYDTGNPVFRTLQILEHLRYP